VASAAKDALTAAPEAVDLYRQDMTAGKAVLTVGEALV